MPVFSHFNYDIYEIYCCQTDFFLFQNVVERNYLIARQGIERFCSRQLL
jgi:hypothetical protein